MMPNALSEEQLEAIRKVLIKYSDLNSQHRIPIHKTKVLDEAQKKFPNEDASNVAVRRLIKRMFTEIDVDATRKQIEELFYEYEFDADSSTDITFDPDKLPLFINKVLALLGGTTNGK